ncbi:MAG: redoxin domain-containing protein [Alphaproteobacteria bacterium]|nr:redoxin domain-containing protein [Alphaproteobacteria bacterium]
MNNARRNFVIAVGAGVAVLGGAFAMLRSPAAEAAVQNGAAAPGFSVVDSAGRTRTLDEFNGKTVVLEWTNHDCPYVKKHYATGNMQALQREATAAGVTWLTVISSAPGKQGHVSGAAADQLTTSRSAAPSAVLLDESGAVGRLYAARTTPHMYVIGPDRKLVYQGGIDDRNSSDHATVQGARNYVREALAAVRAGRAPETASAPPYGCSIKYAG